MGSWAAVRPNDMRSSPKLSPSPPRRTSINKHHINPPLTIKIFPAPKLLRTPSSYIMKEGDKANGRAGFLSLKLELKHLWIMQDL